MIPQKQILVVEDNEINREMLKEILSGQYRVQEAENGQEALEVLRRFKDDIALILLDVIMPVMDGYAFLDYIKADRELSLIPVIIMTQSDSEADEVAALSHGATDFVPKPYRPQVILHRIASLIHFRETAAMVNQFQYDRLTGLYTKEFFYQKAGEVLEKNPDKNYDIICSNIENFKLFNDIFGVPAGDLLLKEIAGLYTKHLGYQGICSRQGDDRFMCLCEHQQKYDDEMFLEFGAHINGLSKMNNNVVLKWGIYEITDRSVPVESMCDRAFLAAGKIKGQYYHCVAVYDDEVRSHMLREQAIINAMEEALKKEQFTVYFQPKYCLDGERMAGAEALVRWNHPELGFISPEEFIPIFEKNGFISRLDQYMWDKVCSLIRKWKDCGKPIVPVSVNVSRADAYQIDLAEVLSNIVKKHGLTPQELHLEITESAYTEDAGLIVATVDKLRKLGFVIEMDDFGKGYSSLNMLNQMKLDILKLDMQFIQSETAKPKEQGILRFIVGLARWMNLAVVAEGVETREQLEQLKEVGCDYAQGYFFAKPMPAEEFEALLQEETVISEAHFSKKDGASGCLLIADENEEYRSIVRRIFGEEYQILEAADGESACLRISQNRHLISALILSMTLPDGGSNKVLKYLNESHSLWRLPVLATGPVGGEMEEKSLRMEADDFIYKPHTEYVLKKRITRLIGLVSFQEREQRLKDEAYHDYLTGLLNRRGLSVAVNALGQKDMPMAVCIFDLDNLKKVNDSSSHEAGDEMLRSFGNLLKSHTREDDIVCRYGGDEFIVVLKRIFSEEAAWKKGEEICVDFRSIRLTGGISAACSAGIALCRSSDLSWEKILKSADKALYRAKASNKGSCCLWTPDL